MSRIGKQIIAIPAGVTVAIANGAITVTGPKSTLSRTIDSRITVQMADNTVTVDVKEKEDKKERSLWGTYAAHVKNMIQGVVGGFKKQLEINGVGYRVALQGKDLRFEVGFSHPVMFVMPDGVKASVEKNIITLESADIELLGRTAAEVRAIRKPEPYKGKGIKYTDEVIRRKAGKTATKASA